ncbi:MAG TPA: cation-transporting P-type ATPase, partial [Gammaproteobacteria bacterium]
MPDRPPRAATTAWHAQTAAACLEQLGVDRHGLRSSEVEARLAQYGANRLPPPPRRSAWRRLAEQFNNVLIYVLLAASVVTALLGHWVDTGVIVGVVVINALIGFVQEGKAERALDAVRGMLSQSALVLRNGIRCSV